LTPEEGNIHEISAGPDGPLAILDILSPPYNDGTQIPGDFTRPCHYYEELESYISANSYREVNSLHFYFFDSNISFGSILEKLNLNVKTFI